MKKVLKNIAIALLVPIIIVIMVGCMFIIFLQKIFGSKKILIDNNNFTPDDEGYTQLKD